MSETRKCPRCRKVRILASEKSCSWCKKKACAYNRIALLKAKLNNLTLEEIESKYRRAESKREMLGIISDLEGYAHGISPTVLELLYLRGYDVEYYLPASVQRWPADILKPELRELKDEVDEVQPVITDMSTENTEEVNNETDTQPTLTEGEPLLTENKEEVNNETIEEDTPSQELDNEQTDFEEQVNELLFEYKSKAAEQMSSVTATVVNAVNTALLKAVRERRELIESLEVKEQEIKELEIFYHTFNRV